MAFQELKNPVILTARCKSSLHLTRSIVRAGSESTAAPREREREIDAERRPMYPVSGQHNGAVDYTYMYTSDTKYNTAVADYTVVIQSTVNAV